MAKIAQDVIDDARRLINDELGSAVSGVRWSDAELLDWITDGQYEMAKFKPEALVKTDLFTVVGDEPRQRLDPTVAYRLMRVEANGSSAVHG